MDGSIHSLETFGTLDGPGIRFVLFTQGCALQCQYCHNPDTWDTSLGKKMSVEQVLAEIEPYLEYYRRSGGGITVTGGEPSLQATFVAELFKQCKSRWGLHTCLDSSGFCDPSHADELLKYTDLVLLDLKMMDREKHIALTRQPNDRTLRFAEHLSARGTKMWIRHVLVPGLTDEREDLLALGKYIRTLNNVEKVEILPYHRMGVYKWEKTGKKYPLEGVQSPTADEVKRAYKLIDRSD